MPTFLGAAVGLCKIVCFLKGGSLLQSGMLDFVFRFSKSIVALES